MFMNDVLTDRDVHGHRHTELIPGRENADVAVRKVFLGDCPSDRLPQPDSVAESGGGCIVDSAGLTPEAEFTRANVPGNTFAGPADQGQLVIVDRAGAVQRNV